MPPPVVNQHNVSPNPGHKKKKPVDKSNNKSEEETKKSVDATVDNGETGNFVARLQDTVWKVNKWNVIELKHTLDDGIRSILLEDFKFDEDYTHLNRKLLLGYSAVTVATIASLYSLKYPISEIRWTMFLLVGTFFLLHGALNFYTQYIEGQTIFVGVQKDPLGLEKPRFVQVMTLLKKATKDEPTPQYAARFQFSKGSLNDSRTETKFEGGVGKWFDEDGRLGGQVLWDDVTGCINDNILHVE